ncbi:Subtilisin-like protein [Apiospora rasikravindrae]|uniref:Subtilisin-like protein n=1 Tax=Apiospora rasikravindrae TaxID=990691 RepID=A0ABR1UE99_9PEZI
MILIQMMFVCLCPLSVLARAPLLSRDAKDAVDNSWIVVLKQDLAPPAATDYYNSLRTLSKPLLGLHRGLRKTFENVNGLHAFHIECDKALLETIRNHPSVAYIAQDGKVTVQAAIKKPVPRDDSGNSIATSPPPWGLARISHRPPGMIGYLKTSAPKTRLYVLDTGIQLKHQEFGGRAIWGKTFIDGAPDDDDNGHGTHAAATAAGNTVGVDNTTIPVAVKCLDKNSAGTWSGVMAAIDWACGNATALGMIKRSVINMSIGGSTYQPLDDMVQRAYAQGMMVVVAASNYGADACGYSPARGANATTVAAIDKSDGRAGWSNWGACVDLFAPGVDITSAWPDATGRAYATLSGTSMASPHVAGLATYLISRENLHGADMVRRRLIELATSDMVHDPKGSPNKIAFNGAGDTVP